MKPPPTKRPLSRTRKFCEKKPPLFPSPAPPSSLPNKTAHSVINFSPSPGDPKSSLLVGCIVGDLDRGVSFFPFSPFWSGPPPLFFGCSTRSGHSFPFSFPPYSGHGLSFSSKETRRRASEVSSIKGVTLPCATVIEIRLFGKLEIASFPFISVRRSFPPPSPPLWWGSCGEVYRSTSPPFPFGEGDFFLFTRKGPKVSPPF